MVVLFIYHNGNLSKNLISDTSTIFRFGQSLSGFFCVSMITYDDALTKQARQIHCKRYINKYGDAHTQKKNLLIFKQWLSYIKNKTRYVCLGMYIHTTVCM